MGNEYQKYRTKITEICDQYGYQNCEQCPLFYACCSQRKEQETGIQYTERIENALVKAYKTLQKEG